MPVITKRKVTPPAAPAPQTNVSVPQLTVETTAPAPPASTHTEVGTPSADYGCDYDIPLFYYNPFAPLFHFLWIALLIILGVILAVVIIQLLLFSFMGLILFIFPKYQRCKNCGKIFKYSRKIERCPYCGALIEDEIKPH